MPTLILVHGTFASGPEEGQRWWQRGSEFDIHLKEMVAADGGELAVERLIWDGENSLSSRRAAGKALYEKMKGLDKAGEPFCLLGHSHGGSVIAEALTRAAVGKHQLQHLRRWITVGTPFIEPRKERWLFSRLGHLGKVVLVAITTFAFSAVVGSFTLEAREAIASAVLAVALMPFLLVYFLLKAFDIGRHAHFRRRVLARFDKTFAARWFGIWHRDDEAIGGLAALGRSDRAIFSKDFAVPSLAMLALIVFPLLIYAALSNAGLAQWLFEFHLQQFGAEKLKELTDGNGLRAAGKDISANLVLLLTTGGEIFTLIYPGSSATARAVFLILVVPILFLLVALLVLLLVTQAARPVSHVLSWVLNGTTWSQLRARGFGGDVLGERVVGAGPTPIGLSRRFAVLPDDIARELAAVSDAAAAQSIPKLREAIHKFAFAGEGSERGVLAEYLTSRELIHTTYFDVPCVRKLMAYAISEADGFKATEKFKADADYVLVGVSYRVLDDRDVAGQAIEHRAAN